MSLFAHLAFTIPAFFVGCLALWWLSEKLLIEVLQAAGGKITFRLPVFLLSATMAILLILFCIDGWLKFPIGFSKHMKWLMPLMLVATPSLSWLRAWKKSTRTQAPRTEVRQRTRGEAKKRKPI
jgi:cellulose synthase/poly-beta-1,6-N-acetylglucosamine synthase-like glycosyltransferase